MKLVRAKIVPDTDPNADGVWVAGTWLADPRIEGAYMRVA